MKNVISDKAEVAYAQSTIKSNQANNESTGADSKGSCIEGWNLLPIGSQIFLEYNIIEKGEINPKNGMILAEEAQISVYPKVIAIGGNVKTINVGDRIYLKAAAINFIEPISNTKFHVVYETSILGIYTGEIEPAKKVYIPKQDSKIII